MPSPGPRIQTATTARQRGMRPRGRIGRLVAVVVAIVTLMALIFTAGFALFLWRIPTEESGLDRKADGIVVLTGGASRISDAIELLAAGRGQRLLISGVHRSTNQAEIARLLPEHEKIITCCVDLDRAAVNTVGNATGTRRWVNDRGFRSVIVVTSNYHMPRAMAELSHQLPEVALIPFPVIANKSPWSHAANLRLLLSEYLKYIVAVVRMRFDQVSGSEAA